MNSAFNEVIGREGTGCAKYDNRKQIFGKEDVLPFWIADMDFRSPQIVIDELQKRVAHGIYGYPVMPDIYLEPVVSWINRRHGWKIMPEWICFSPGVVPALSFCVLAYTNPGDGIIVQPPVYFPFFRTIESQGRRKIDNPLALEGNRYTMDFDHLESLVSNGARMIFLCNPHKPGGRVWNREELTRLSRLCIDNGVVIISDEIHSDLIYSGHKHIPVASLDDGAAFQTITCMAPSKTFNLAGLASSFVIIPDENKRKIFRKLLEDYHLHHGNIFGLAAMKAAYEKGESWLQELVAYLEANRDLMDNYISSEIPELTMMKPEATCLAWINFSQLNLRRKELNEFLINRAGVGLSDGQLFGNGGEGFQRFNFACPGSILGKGLEKLKFAVDKRHTT